MCAAHSTNHKKLALQVGLCTAENPAAMAQLEVSGLPHCNVSLWNASFLECNSTGLTNLEQLLDGLVQSGTGC